ncbi:MAG: hypothetical protein WAO91_00395 [Candidatus Nitrosotenuis sp.]
MRREQLIDAIIEKTKKVEELEAKLRNQNGRAIIAKIVCKDNDTARQIESILLHMMQSPENPIEYGTAHVVDESTIENLYLHLDIQSINFFNTSTN